MIFYSKVLKDQVVHIEPLKTNNLSNYYYRFMRQQNFLNNYFDKIKHNHYFIFRLNYKDWIYEYEFSIK